MIEDALKAEISKALELQGYYVAPEDVPLWRPRNPENGDFTTNVALLVAADQGKYRRQHKERVEAARQAEDGWERELAEADEQLAAAASQANATQTVLEQGKRSERCGKPTRLGRKCRRKGHCPIHP